MKMRILLIAVLVLAAACPAAQPRQIYGHYMGCCPAGHGAIPYWFSKAAQCILDTNDVHAAVGGRYVNWPLMPYNPERLDLGMESNAVLEIRRAMRAGLDGFAFDAWAGSEGARKELDAFFAAAEKMGVDFGLTICFDPSCHGRARGETMLDRYVDTAEFVLRHKNSPNLARRDGKPLFFGYYSSGIAYGPKDEDLAVRLAREKAAWDEFRRRVGVPVFIHGSLDSFALLKDPDWRLIGEWAAKTYDAVGGFLGTERSWNMNRDLIDAVKKGGAVWSQPMFFQYSNKAGGIITKPGLDWLRANWEAAIANGSDLVQFVTWNDYGEETCLAPSTGGAYTITRVNRYYAELWKTGRAPKIDEDEVHVVFRRWTDGAPTFPFRTRTPVIAPSALEVVTFLKAPARVEVKGYGAYDAPAGMHSRQIPLKEGIVAARVRRDEDGKAKTVCGVVAPELVAARRWREDFTLVAFGSNFEREWREDFGERPPDLYAENADADGDGLPNWFEMVYFGRFPYMSTATAAEPSADPDGDGATNIEEFCRGTDPTKKDVPYAPGETWDVAAALARPFVFNPERDSHRCDVWFAGFKDRVGGALAWDGTITPAPVTGGAAKWRNLYNTNWNARVTFRQDAVELFSRKDCSMAFAWRAPAAGAFAVRAEVSAGKGGGSFDALMFAGARQLGRVKMRAGDRHEFDIPSVRLEKGEMVILTHDWAEAWGLNPLRIEKFKITKKEQRN